MSQILHELNPVQRQAVENFQAASLIIAGAGSGKTRVLTYRIAYMLEQGVKPWSILALTFTNKAAREMKERIASVVGDKQAQQLWMGTFHSVFSRILRAEADKINFPSTFTIYDTADSRTLVNAILRDLNLVEADYKVKDVLARISMAKNNLIQPAAYAANTMIRKSDEQSRKGRVYEVYAEYVRRCKKAGAMDFDDLLLYTSLLFRDCPDVLEKYSQKFQYVLVDEYQDTNMAQYFIVKKMVEQHKNICVVGDDAQSIYSFRGAQIENILNFKKDFPEAQTFKLEQNYRSTQTIVNAANCVIARNSNQLQKKCFSTGEEGEKIAVLPSFTDQEEALRVIGDIYDTVYRQRIEYSEFCILYRTNTQSRLLEDALRRKSIPYRIYGGKSFYQNKEVRDVLAYLRLLVNPNDDEAFKRVVNYPKRGIGTTTIQRIEQAAAYNDISMWNAILSLTPEQAELKGSAYQKVSQFLVMIDDLAQTSKDKSAYELAQEVAHKSGIIAALRAQKTIEAEADLQNIESLLNGIKEFCENYLEEHGEEPQLNQYLENVALLTDADEKQDEDKNKVALMTVHSAKGLEFGYVYIVGLEENLFPSLNTLSSKNDEEEERRLFYVALTRAKTKATLSFAQSRMRWGTPVTASPSRFLAEIDECYLALPMRPQFDEQDYSQDPDDYKFVKKKTLAPETTTAFVPKKHLTRLSQLSTNSTFEAADVEDMKVGVTVEHERFGRGEIIGIEDVGGDVKVSVDFELAGKKNLLLKYAKLRLAK
ncbi:MAG: ATP-dependent helicase [Bacteroidales bacterium]